MLLEACPQCCACWSEPTGIPQVQWTLTRAEEPMNRFFYAHEIAKPEDVTWPKDA